MRILSLACLLLLSPSGLPAQPVNIVGSIACSQQYGSGWIDLGAPADFKAGTVLVVSLTGGAQEILVRLANKKRCRLDTPCGVIGGTHKVENGTVRVELPVSLMEIDHISVHGGDRPFATQLVKGNGPACLTSAWTE